MSLPEDRFDEIRRKWIARNQRSFTFQKRRQEILARQIRDRATIKTGARVDPADDDVMHVLLERLPKTVYGARDWALVGILALLAPIGWAAGKGIYKAVLQLIPGELRSYPVAAFMWSAFCVGLPIAWLSEPDPSSLTATVVVPYLFAQLPAALLAAGLYGIIEGWLAVDGARDWWPKLPPPNSDHVDFGLTPEEAALPGIFLVSAQDPPGERTPIGRDR